MKQSLTKAIIVILLLVCILTLLYQISIATEREQEYPIDLSLKGRVAKIVVHKQKRILELYDDKISY